ncbi:MAG: hypothetical protein M0P29_11180 [Sphaerochaetaceae bacterium]|jgi:predicted transcriptional regulator|nr:hypothetical protein [Sphaerochaetaceae bacterium]
MSERLIDGLTVKLPPKVRDALRTIARDNDKSMSEVAREYIIDGLKADGITEEAEHD